MPGNNYLVTAIITTRNRPVLVEEAISGVLSQSHRNIEIILVDDSDTDGSCKKLLGLSTRIKYIKNATRSGACYSRNIGITEARGDFIAFLDDDDLWLPTKIESQLAAAINHPLVGCNYISKRGSKKTCVRRPEFVSYGEMLYNNYLGSCSFVLGEAAAIRKCAFDPTLEAGQDWDMWLTIMKANKIPQVCNIQSCLAIYNQGEHLRISNTAQHARAVLALYEKRLSDYTPDTTALFALYNLINADGDILLWGMREYMKARLKKLGLFTIFRVLFSRMFGKRDYF